MIQLDWAVNLNLLTQVPSRYNNMYVYVCHWNFPEILLNYQNFESKKKTIEDR